MLLSQMKKMYLQFYASDSRHLYNNIYKLLSFFNLSQLRARLMWENQDLSMAQLKFGETAWRVLALAEKNS